MVEKRDPIIHKVENIKYEELDYRKNPHNKIQEAYLFDGANSYHIKNIDGDERLFIYNKNDFQDNPEENEYYKIDVETEYPSHIPKIKALKFKQVYKLTPSVSGNGFKTWQPIVRLFKGFTNTK
jgi:CRISPR type III-associated protein (TIGR04423 family)